METNESSELREYAVQVCLTCKARKKRCDKKLPVCTYCEQRDVECEYTTPTPRRKAEGNISSKRSIAQIGQTSSPYAAPSPNSEGAWSFGDHRNVQSLCPGLRSTVLLVSSASEYLPPWNSQQVDAAAVSYDGLVHLQASRVLQITGQSIDDFADAYFKGPQKWMPLFVEKTFRERLALYRISPKSDFAMVLVGMCLVTYYPWQTSAHVVDQETLYSALKGLYGGCHSQRPATVDMVRGAILFAMYEYASGKLEAACVSISVAARMGYSLGLHKSFQQRYDGRNDTDPTEQEDRMIWWAIMVFERAILCELPSQPPTTELPVITSEQHYRNGTEHGCFGFPNAPSILRNTGLSMGEFERLVHATYLTDQLLLALRNPDFESKKAELVRIDGEIRNLLGIITGLDRADPDAQCAPMAMSLRSLYILNRHIIYQIPAIETTRQLHNHAWTELDFATKMIIDIALSHPVEIYPDHFEGVAPVCHYTTRAALEHVSINQARGVETPSTQREALRRLFGIFKTRWGISEA